MSLDQYRARRFIVISFAITIAITLILLELMTAGLVTQAAAVQGINAQPVGTSLIYRFDPNTQTFISITLPMNAIPMDLAVSGSAPTHIWFSEYGGQQIGHLIYTDTVSNQLVEYPVTSTTLPQPYQVKLANNNLWFTERGANRVGRLNTLTGQIDEFYGNGLSANGSLADIEVAPDGRVWIAAPGSKSLVQLIVTNTLTYAFHEYTDTLRPSNVLVPEFLAVANNDLLWITNPQASASSRVVNFRPSIPLFTQATSLSTGTPIYPREIVVTAGNVWYANQGNNTLDQIETGTNPNINHRVSITSPVRLVPAGGSTFWVLQQTRPAAISRAIYTDTSSTSSVATYALPVADLMLTSIAVADDGKVWLTAYQPNQIFLPLVRKD